MSKDKKSIKQFFNDHYYFTAEQEKEIRATTHKDSGNFEERFNYLDGDGVRYNMPSGFRNINGNLCKNDGKEHYPPFLFQLLYIKTEYRNISTGEYKTEIAYNIKPGRFKTLTVDNLVISSYQQVLKLAKYNVKVNSVNARALVLYLALFKEYNSIPMKESISSLGHVKDYTGFAPYPETLQGEAVTLEKSEGFERSINALKEKGSAEISRNLLKDFYNHSVENRIIISAFIGGLFLKPFSLNCFLIHVHGDSAKGKTTLFKLLCSFFGDPEILLLPLSATEKSLTKQLGFLNNVPIVLDEMSIKEQDKYKSNDFDQLILTLTEGAEKTKLKQSKLTNSWIVDENRAYWNTTIFTNSNYSIIKHVSDEAIYSRVFEIECSNSFIPEKYTGYEVNDLINNNYGFIGHEVVKHVFDTFKGFNSEEIKALFVKTAEDLNKGFIDFTKMYNPKQLNQVSIILFASEILNRCYNLQPLKRADILPFMKTREETDINRKAFDYLLDTINKNINKFIDVDNYQSEKWGCITDDYICILPTVYREMMNKGGYDQLRLLRYMKNNNILDSKDRRFQKRTRAYDGTPKRMIVLFNRLPGSPKESLINTESRYYEEEEQQTLI